MKRPIFWDITTCSPLEANRRLGGTCGLNHLGLFATRFMLVSYLAYSSNLKIKTTCSSENSTEFQRTTRRYIPEDKTLQILFMFGIQ
jgi:hypothetical protein